MTRTSGDKGVETQELVSLSGLNAVLSAAAYNSPDHVLVEDDGGATTAGTFARRTAQLAEELRTGGFQRGERVLIVAGALTASLVALMAVLRAGLEPVLVSCGIGAVELAQCAGLSGAVALIGPSHYGGFELGEQLLSVAALTESVRGVLTHGPERVDGAADISFAAIDAAAASANGGDGKLLELPTIATFARSPGGPRLIVHRQATLFADALSLIEQARINPSRQVISLMPPASLAGLIGGPFAAFAGASRLVYHGPFAAKQFLAFCDKAGGAHLLVPMAAAGSLAAVLGADAISSLMLSSRHASMDDFGLPPPIAIECPVVDLYAFGEETLIAQRRQQHGRAEPPRRTLDLSHGENLGARLNRARAEQRLQQPDAAQ